MKYFDWSEEKNNWLKKNRNISFEEIELAISTEHLIDIVKHPNENKYPNQKVFFVEIEGYIWFVPFVEDEEKIFLKTAYPNRKINSLYKNGESNEKK